MRGTGTSEGDFSIEGWLADVRAAIDALHARTDITGVWLSGFRLGGTLAVVAAAHDNRVRGLATFSAPASLHWVEDPVGSWSAPDRVEEPDYLPDPALDPLIATLTSSTWPATVRPCRSSTAPTTTSFRPTMRARRRKVEPASS
jgi:pimeloyl-ACP methyl ester carboxylesterase